MKLLFLFTMLIILLPFEVFANDKLYAIKKIINTKKYEISNKMNPTYLVADFNGDGKKDIALYIKELSSGFYGICILHTGDSNTIVLAAGNKNLKDIFDLTWVDEWKVVSKGESWEATFFPEGHKFAGDLDGERKVMLDNSSIEVCASEGSCKTFTFKKGKYISFHQGC